MKFFAVLISSISAIASVSVAHGTERQLLVTPHYNITIWLKCSEGQDQLDCPLIGHVYDLKRHTSIQLAGFEAFASGCRGRVPCHTGAFVYALKDGGYNYVLYPSGKLVVTHKGRNILSETGAWTRLAPNNSFKPKPLRGSA